MSLHLPSSVPMPPASSVPLSSQYKYFPTFRVSFAVCEELIRKGYEVCLNIANCESLTRPNIELIKSAYRASSRKLKCVYLADTFGACRPGQITRLKILFEDLPIAYHSHSHSGRELANTLQAMDAGFVMVDSCLGGLGKNSGNAATERLLFFKHGSTE